MQSMGEGKISVNQLPVSAPSRTATTEDTIQHGPMQVSSPLPQSTSNHLHLLRREANYIEASAEDEAIMSEEASSQCLVLFADSDLELWKSFKKGGSSRQQA